MTPPVQTLKKKSTEGKESGEANNISQETRHERLRKVQQRIQMRLGVTKIQDVMETVKTGS